MLRLARTALIVICCAPVLAACGGGGSDEDQIKDVTASFVSDIKGEKWSDACDKLSAKAKKQFEQAGAALGVEGCEAVFKKVMSADNKPTEDDGKVSNIKVSGNTATGKAGGDTTHFVKEGGDWKI